MPLWALPNHQFRYPEFFQQKRELEQEGNRAWYAYMNDANKSFDGNDHSVPYYDEPHLDHSHYRCCLPPDQHTPSDHSNEELRMTDILARLLLEIGALRLELDEVRNVVDALTAEDCASDDTDSAVLDEPDWFLRGDGEEGEREDSMEQYQCSSCGFDHPTFAAASVAPKEEKQPEEGKGKGKEVKREELLVPTLVHEEVTENTVKKEEKAVNTSGSESSGLSSSA
ncbi:uncharacterized protein PG998_006200 [Apiospora kogelbergensis]|uniref:Uncharacterized protein n=1 Tax=Apiospora kogelbergensis TaxID=1337665 RepID=A0AAW0R4T2_9PEZI